MRKHICFEATRPEFAYITPFETYFDILKNIGALKKSFKNNFPDSVRTIVLEILERIVRTLSGQYFLAVPNFSMENFQKKSFFMAKNIFKET